MQLRSSSGPAVELRSQVADDVTLAFFFAHESAPPDASDDVRFGDGHEVELLISTADIAEASKGWVDELEHFPAR